MASKETDQQLDQILHSVGDNGRYQRLLFWLILVPLNIMVPWTCLVPIFQSSVPDHWCYVPGKPDNVSMELWKNLTIPWKEENGEFSRSKCEQYTNITFVHDNTSDSVIDIKHCENGWEFDQMWYDRTLATDREWVCDQSSYSARWLSAGVAGNVVGTLIFNCLSDYWGRKLIVIAVTQFYAVLAIVRMFLSSEIGLLAFMFLSSMTFPANFEVSMIMVMEQVSADMRAQITCVVFIVWTIGMCMIPLMAWLTRDWIILGILSAVPFFPFLLAWWYFPDSPRWLLSRGRVEDSYKAYKRIAKMNGKKCPPDLRITLNNIAQKEDIKSRGLMANFSFIELFQYPVLRKRLILLTLCYVCNNAIYYGIIYNTSNISGNEFLNFFYLSISELPGNFIGWYCSQTFGRRFTEAGFFFLGALTALLAIIVSYLKLAWIEILVAVTCKTLINISFLVVYLQLAELLPTSHRAAGTGFASILASLFGISTPYIAYSSYYWDPLPYLILVVIAVIGMTSSIFLPETIGTSLPQTIDDAEVFLIDQPFWSYYGWRPRTSKVQQQPEPSFEQDKKIEKNLM